MVRALMAAAILAALATSVRADVDAGSGSGAPPVSRPPATSAIPLNWAALPNANDLAQDYPEEARDKGLSGDTRIQCTVEPDGTLVDCETLEEKPAGMGFGAAAIAASRHFRMTPYAPALVHGQLPRVIIPIHWQVEALPVSAPLAAKAPATTRTTPDATPNAAPVEPFPGFFVGFPVFFPVFFIALWFLVTSVLGLLSGWYGLMERYPDRREPLLAKVGSQSGMMGPIGVSLRGILTLEACPSGLRVSIWRIFGPFSRPFFVPWRDVSARPVTLFFSPMVRLSFGNPEVGVLSVYARAWERLAGAARPAAGAQVPSVQPVSQGRLARSAFVQWVVMTALAAAFFYFAPRLMSPQAEPLPLPVCIGFPAVVFGVGQLFRYLRQQG